MHRIWLRAFKITRLGQDNGIYPITRLQVRICLDTPILIDKLLNDKFWDDDVKIERLTTECRLLFRQVVVRRVPAPEAIDVVFYVREVDGSPRAPGRNTRIID